MSAVINAEGMLKAGEPPAMEVPVRRRGRRRRQSGDAHEKARRPNIHGVAAKAGVSVVTVSRVFNDFPHISDEIRARVFDAARAIGYAPRVVARQNVLGIIVGQLNRLGTCDFESRLLVNVIRAASRSGYLIECIPYEAAHLATKHFAAGLLAIGPTREELRMLQDLPNVPKVAINRGAIGEGWSSLCTDPFREAALAVQHVATRGHRRIAMVLDDQDWITERRREGFQSELSGFPGCEGSVFVVGSENSLPVDVGRLVANFGYSALLNFSERYGLSILDALANQMGVVIPADLSVVSLEHESVSRHMSPPLTAVAIPLRLMAEYAVSALDEQAKSGRGPFETTFESRLIERASVRHCA
jgi:DNA-binding LacI/PurR family transcriptional regulator